jgi:hypothetical protein
MAITAGAPGTERNRRRPKIEEQDVGHGRFNQSERLASH